MSLLCKNASASVLLSYFAKQKLSGGEIVSFELLETDVEKIGYKALVDLAQLFFMRLLTPRVDEEGVVLLRFEKLRQNNSFHHMQSSTEKYGVASEFFRIEKTAQFSFLYHFQKALEFVGIEKRERVVNLGINKGDEFGVIKEMLGDELWSEKEFVGIDYAASAIAYAKKEFAQDKNVTFLCADINKLHEYNVGRFDLLVSIGTLQSSNIEFNKTFMGLYQNHLEDGGAVVLGFPNCRWIDGEMIYGAKAPNYPFSELSLVLKDIHFCKKYLQQKKYRVVITGKDYLFLSARKIV